MLLLNLSAMDLSLLPADRLDNDDESDSSESRLIELDDAVDKFAWCSFNTFGCSLEQLFLKDVSARGESLFLGHSRFKPNVEMGLNFVVALFPGRTLFSLLISAKPCWLDDELAASLLVVFSR